MAASDEDIQASAKMTALRPRSMANDSAHYFRRRTILQVFGDLSGLSDIAVCAPPRKGERGHFVPLLDAAGFLDADLYVAPYENGALIDIHADLADAVADRLEAIEGVNRIDRSAGARWRVFGELPDQKSAVTPYEAIRFADTRRRELGVRVFRDAAEPEGLDWRHARKWDGHALRLGLLPDHRCIVGKGIKPEEAGYHRLAAGPDRPASLVLSRRILPVRVDTYDSVLTVMAGAPLTAGDTVIGTMLDQEGVCGIALVSLEPWRLAIAEGARLFCSGLPILISWPTWLSSESEGRVGPAGNLI
jgi:hypothetical protein